MAHQSKNVGDWERLGSLAFGAMITLNGLRRGGLSGLLKAGAGASLLYRGMTGNCKAYEAMGIDTSQQSARGLKVIQSVRINRPADELYAYWRNLENLPRIMTHLVSVAEHTSKRSHWAAEGPLGTTLEWEAEIINERPNEFIAWRSLPGADLDNAGSVRFIPRGNGQTEVRVSMSMHPTGGSLGVAAAKLLGENPDHQIAEDLQNFKHLMESGDRTSLEVRTGETVG